MIIVEFVEPFDNPLDGAKVKNRVVGSLASTETFGGFKGSIESRSGFIHGTAVTVYASYLNPGSGHRSTISSLRLQSPSRPTTGQRSQMEKRNLLRLNDPVHGLQRL